MTQVILQVFCLRVAGVVYRDFFVDWKLIVLLKIFLVENLQKFKLTTNDNNK